MKKTMCLVVILLFASVFQARADEPIGVVVNTNTNSIHLINPLTQDISPSRLGGTLGSYGGGLFDVVLTPNGRTAIVSNFGDSTIFFIDIVGGFSANPTLLGSVLIPFFAEDMDVTPDGKYVLITDGGFSPRIAVVDISGQYLIHSVNLHAQSAQAIDISPDGKIILVADYFGSAIHSYDLGSNGDITFKATYDISPTRPVNVTISPDGKTVIVVSANRYDFPVFQMDAGGNLLNEVDVTIPGKGGQSCVFSHDGTRAYYHSNGKQSHQGIAVLSITGAGIVSFDSFISMSIPRGTSQLFGVDTIDIDPSGNYLYVSNPTVSGGVVEVTVIDLTTDTEVNQLAASGIPVGIVFGVIQPGDCDH